MNEAHIASRMTARHSPLFTLESGQSGLGIYTSQRDPAPALSNKRHPPHFESVDNGFSIANNPVLVKAQENSEAKAMSL